ncbi:MAG TPA: hypothetical protein PKY01_05805 [Candidatus Hydrogenedentes bacterium]|nr:hypothetical protein [Candidatus Hydrogenedentota bacterium]HQH51919.1 hypothetical protein [Candidatus Hydrogenedentota bacterium]HQM50235.1 hypothetical protein [Candidatus Hydrogenedentota bacterium]
MPTKYHRQSFRDHVAEQHPYLRVSRTSAPPVAEKVRRPGYMLTASICAIIAVLLLGNALAKISEYYGQPEIKGKGVIVSKRLEEAGTPGERYVVFVDILRPEGDPIRRDVFADKSSFERFSVGEEVPLVYQMNRSGKDARIVTLFMPVPPEEARQEGMLKKDE